MTARSMLTADVVLIDGRSGSGKTTLAVSLADKIARERGVRPQVIGMDELYPGWGGLAAGSASLPGILRSAAYFRYDWAREQFVDRIALDPSRPCIVEGCGSLTRAAIASASEWGSVYTVWIAGPEALRKQRALARDGDMFAPYWASWAEQERAHFAIARPWSIAREMMHTDTMRTGSMRTGSMRTDSLSIDSLGAHAAFWAKSRHAGFANEHHSVDCSGAETCGSHLRQRQ